MDLIDQRAAVSQALDVVSNHGETALHQAFGPAGAVRRGAVILMRTSLQGTRSRDAQAAS
jgi:hypothetical protein